MKQAKHSIKDADFIVYRRKFGDGLWQTVSTWMRTEYP